MINSEKLELLVKMITDFKYQSYKHKGHQCICKHWIGSLIDVVDKFEEETETENNISLPELKEAIDEHFENMSEVDVEQMIKDINKQF